MANTFKDRLDAVVVAIKKMPPMESLNEDSMAALNDVVVELIARGYNFNYAKYPNGRHAAHFENESGVYPVVTNSMVEAIIGSAERTLGLVTISKKPEIPQVKAQEPKPVEKEVSAKALKQNLVKKPKGK